ncbi:MAG: hypothetical protein KF761_05410 [Salinibacterium sp.]|nr:hypothetical protein [Salinibacterium sp.]
MTEKDPGANRRRATVVVMAHATTGWHLGTYTPKKSDGSSMHIDMGRELSGSEYESYRNDVDLLSRVSVSGSVLELAEAFQKVIADANYMVSGDRAGETREIRSSRARNMKNFLSELVATRQRLSALLDERLPDEAPALRATFEGFYKKERHFRLAWELRNEGEHGRDPLAHSRLSERLVDDAVERRWIFDLPSLFAAHSEEKPWRAAAALWGDADDVVVLTVIAHAYSVVELCYSFAVVNQESQIRAAAARIAALHSEAAVEGKYPAVFNVGYDPDAAVPRALLGMNLQLVPIEVAVEAEHSIAAAHKNVDHWFALKAANSGAE